MIKIIGDVHSKTGDYKRLVRSMEPGQRSIQVGIWGSASATLTNLLSA